MPLSRTTPLKRGGPLRRVSKKMGALTRAKRKVYDATKASECFSCGPGCCADLTPSHILTQGQHKKFRLHPDNLVWECWATHQLWENNKPAYARAYPEAFALKMERMHELHPQAAAFFRVKNANLFQ